MLENFIKALDYNPLTGDFRWKGKNSGKKVGSVDRHGYLRITLKGDRVFAHRLAWVICNGSISDLEIDHINNNPLDNRIVNLRLATRSQNQQNKKQRSDNKSSVKGVCWDKNRNLWQAHCQIDGKKFFVGRFVELCEAETAVKKFRLEKHRSFSNNG